MINKKKSKSADIRKNQRRASSSTRGRCCPKLRKSKVSGMPKNPQGLCAKPKVFPGAVRKGQTEVMNMALFFLIAVILLFSAFVWGNSVIGGNSDEAAVFASEQFMRSLDSKIENVAKNGGSEILQIKPSASISIVQNTCKGMYGDLNGNNRIDANDADVAFQYISNPPADYCQKIKADMNGDGLITNTDRDFILNYPASPYGIAGQHLFSGNIIEYSFQGNADLQDEWIYVYGDGAAEVGISEPSSVIREKKEGGRIKMQLYYRNRTGASKFLIFPFMNYEGVGSGRIKIENNGSVFVGNLVMNRVKLSV